MEKIPPFKLGYRPALDGLRGIAVLSVLALHALIPPPPIAFIRDHMRTVWMGGFLGVDMFFVLSGFLITALMIQEMDRTGTVSLTRFYIRRALRLLPVLFVFLVVGLLFVIIFRSADEQVVANHDALKVMAYIPNYLPIGTTAFRHTWSLGVEEQFYLIWPGLLLTLLWLLRRLKIDKRWLVLILAIGVCCVVLERAYLYSVEGEGRVYQALDTRADSLLCGCIVGLLAAWDMIPKARKIINVLGVLSAFFLLVMFLHAYSSAPYLYKGVLTLVAVAVSLIIVMLITSPPRWFLWLMEIPALVWIGRISYGIYLWHGIVYYQIFSLFPQVPFAPVLKIGLTIIIAAVSFYLLEQPFLRLKDRFEPSGRMLNRGV